MLDRAGVMSAVAADAVYPTLKSAMNAFLSIRSDPTAGVPDNGTPAQARPTRTKLNDRSTRLEKIARKLHYSHHAITMSQESAFMNQCPSRPLATTHQRWRFAMVLAASLLLAVAHPLTSGLFGDEGSFDVFFSLLIGAVMLLVLEEREHRITAISLGVISILGTWIGYGMGGSAGRVLLMGSHLLAACAFAFALYRILRAV